MLIVNQIKTKTSENMELSIRYLGPENYPDCYQITNENIILGYYKTEERAKEVLKDIVSRYEAIELCKNKSAENLGYILADYTPVYEMPKE